MFRKSIVVEQVDFPIEVEDWYVEWCASHGVKPRTLNVLVPVFPSDSSGHPLTNWLATEGVDLDKYSDSGGTLYVSILS